MSGSDFDRWVEDARAVSIESEIARRSNITLRKSGVERIGPCPVCGGTDRFSINTVKGVFNCRGCERGGDVIELVQFLDGSEFNEAVEKLTGRKRSRGNGNGRDDHDNVVHLSQAKSFELIATYPYTDRAGKVLYEVQRLLNRATNERAFRQRHQNTRGEWINNIRGIPRVPYRLPDLIKAKEQGKIILIVEGEKDVDNCYDMLGAATCNPMGAGKWPKMAMELNPFFYGADVVIIGDNDDPGRAHVEDIVRELSFIAASIRIVHLEIFWSDCPHKGDISKWIEQTGGDKEEFWDYVATLPIETPRAFIQSSAQFVRDFVPPDYLIKDVLQRRFLYAFTGRTGSGKTAVVLLIAACVALSRNIGDLEVSGGRVLYLAGENPDDVRMRWIAMAQQMDFDVNTIEVYFCPGRFKISEMREKIVDELKRIGDVVLVIIDTSAAYYEGDEVNSNTQQAQHARMMRTLVGLPGGPCVLVNCHPIKNAPADNLLPLGAGAFLNEIDGNLTCAITGASVEVHWQGKIRGSDFEPLSFEIEGGITHERLVDSKGYKIKTVIARTLSKEAKEEKESAAKANLDLLLQEIHKDGKASYQDYANRSNCSRSTIQHRVGVLKNIKHWITGDPQDWEITDKGKKRLKKLRGEEPEFELDDNEPRELKVVQGLCLEGKAGNGAKCSLCKGKSRATSPLMMIGDGVAKAEPLHLKCAKVYWERCHDMPER